MYRGTEEGGNDVLFGGVGNDALAGQTGSDLLKGGPGDDEIATFGIAGTSPQISEDDQDTVRAGRSDDLIHAEDPEAYLSKDFIHCGGGTDTVYFEEGLDEVSEDCEIRHPQNQPAS